MIILYNLIQWLGLLLFSPVLLLVTLLAPKYRGRVPRRLGFGLDRASNLSKKTGSCIWVHALSVGEVSSSVPLVKAIRSSFPGARIVFSTTTKTGDQMARQRLAKEVDRFIPFPFDVYFSVTRFIKQIQPNLFILVETDLWPNFLHTLRQKNIPAILVNGRVSEKSFRIYTRFGFFFAPLFQSFRFISMQTANDADRIKELGVSPERVQPLGNLKYEAVLPETGHKEQTLQKQDLGIDQQTLILTAGSTHDGEEQIILDIFPELKNLFPDLFLILAPRNPERAKDLAELAAQKGIQVYYRSQQNDRNASIMILDTLGELLSLYSISDIAFMGGSLVAEGGHNPLEPAAHGCPVLFGPHMEDFAEIAADLIDAGGAAQISSGAELRQIMKLWLADLSASAEKGRKARELVQKNAGIAERHIEKIKEIIKHPALPLDCGPLPCSLFIIGRPFAYLYGGLMLIRASLYKTGILARHRVAADVISVGNLRVGGSGKTPMVKYIAEFLHQCGKRVAIVSRGYGGKASASVNVVSDGSNILLTAEVSGDEPRLLAESMKNIPVLTGKKRILPMQYAVEHFKADTIILDDAFQHLAVQRDLDLVLFNIRHFLDPRQLTMGRVLPGGLLREPPSALNRAHAFLLTGVNAYPEDTVRAFKNTLKKQFPGRQIFTASFRIMAFKDRDGNEVAKDTILQAPLFGFCGIADPASFQHTLEETGCSLAGFRVFADHHPYVKNDINKLHEDTLQMKAKGLITTEKDMVKIREYLDDAMPVYSVKVELVPDDDFSEFLLTRFV